MQERDLRWSRLPILGWLLVGFHAKHGHQIECAEFNEAQAAFWSSNHEILESTNWLKEVAWRALPDGAHERDQDVVYFTIREHRESIGIVHGVACYRQRSVDRARVTNAAEAAATARGLVQKSVVLLSRWPLFPFLARRLEPVVADYFARHDFGQVRCFRSLVADLNRDLGVVMDSDKMSNASTLSLSLEPYVFGDTCLRQLVSQLGRDLLRLLKLVLLEKRILVVGSPAALVGRTVLSLVSLFPAEWIAPSASTAPMTSAANANSDAEAPDLARYCELAHLPLGLFDKADRCGIIQVEPYIPLTLLREVLLQPSTRAPTGLIAGVSTRAGCLFSSSCRPARVFERSPVRSLLVPRRASKASGSPGRDESATLTNRSERTVVSLREPTPHPDALVELNRGRVYFTPAVASSLTLTRTEKRFMDALIAANTAATLSEETLREQLQWYVVHLALTVVAWSDASSVHLGAMISELDAEFFWRWSHETTHFRRWQATWRRTNRAPLFAALKHLEQRRSVLSFDAEKVATDDLPSALHLDSLRSAWTQWWRRRTPTSARYSSPPGRRLGEFTSRPDEDAHNIRHLDHWETFQPSESLPDSDQRSSYIPGASESAPTVFQRKAGTKSKTLVSTDITLLPERSTK
ncbi:hypothetical protein CCYA_CCYA08G2281 [Cyanidiococcus yangmingshanensis]|nr:hypothetical protein CCYA_CCYA08G2281 [Cyanidiococcus yangmingshanensis]